jgi:hypothetical protein
MMPDQIAIPSAFQAFGLDGHLVDPNQEAKALGTALAQHLKKQLSLFHQRRPEDDRVRD